MFGWLQELIDAIVNAITGGFKSAANEVTNSIWNLMLKWLYNSVYSAIADFFTMMGNMGAEIFDLTWITGNTGNLSSPQRQSSSEHSSSL